MHRKPRTPSRSTSPKGEGKVPRWNWIRGICPKGKDCKFYHDPKAAPKKGTSAAADSGDDEPKPKPKTKPKRKGKPSAPAVGDSFFLEESDDEGIAASVKMNHVKKRNISFMEDIGEIILNEAVYSIRDVWKSVIKKPETRYQEIYETAEVTNHPTVSKIALMRRLRKQKQSS